MQTSGRAVARSFPVAVRSGVGDAFLAGWGGVAWAVRVPGWVRMGALVWGGVGLGWGFAV